MAAESNFLLGTRLALIKSREETRSPKEAHAPSLRLILRSGLGALNGSSIPTSLKTEQVGLLPDPWSALYTSESRKTLLKVGVQACLMIGSCFSTRKRSAVFLSLPHLPLAVEGCVR